MFICCSSKNIKKPLKIRRGSRVEEEKDEIFTKDNPKNLISTSYSKSVPRKHLTITTGPSSKQGGTEESLFLQSQKTHFQIAKPKFQKIEESKEDAQVKNRSTLPPLCRKPKIKKKRKLSVKLSKSSSSRRISNFKNSESFQTVQHNLNDMMTMNGDVTKKDLPKRRSLKYSNSMNNSDHDFHEFEESKSETHRKSLRKKCKKHINDTTKAVTYKSLLHCIQPQRGNIEATVAKAVENKGEIKIGSKKISERKPKPRTTRKRTHRNGLKVLKSASNIQVSLPSIKSLAKKKSPKYDPENIEAPSMEQEPSFLQKDINTDSANIPPEIDLSEIRDNRDQSEMVDHLRDISFLNVMDSNIAPSGQFLGKKPSKISGDQKKYMDRILNKRREINASIINKNVKNIIDTTKKSKEPKPIHNPQSQQDSILLSPGQIYLDEQKECEGSKEKQVQAIRKVLNPIPPTDLSFQSSSAHHPPKGPIQEVDPFLIRKNRQNPFTDCQRGPKVI
ncbi:unnamed protein product [Moneuplotes crassus]|uniref:Uncharacterized protein n=1 Tax=Euplotes crassus TaxID=5936 RepID=A0AAD1Y911_EUPCR|nr:unnamed protein product [Moneuplotes crassus]